MPCTSYSLSLLTRYELLPNVLVARYFKLLENVLTNLHRLEVYSVFQVHIASSLVMYHLYNINFNTK